MKNLSTLSVQNVFLFSILFLAFPAYAQLKVTSTGNVGINTSTPNIAGVGKALTIVGSGGERGLIELKNPSATTGVVLGGIRFYNGTNEGAVMDVVAGTTTTSGQFRFYIRNGAGTHAERIRFDQDGKVGIGTTTPGYQLHVSTNSAGKPTSSTWTIVSDAATKTDVLPYNYGLSLIRQVQTVSYEYNGQGNTPAGEKGVGVVAQNFQTVFPNSVKPFVLTDSTGATSSFLGVDLHELFVTNVVAVKQLDSIVTFQQTESASKIDSLISVISALQNQVALCCSNLQGINPTNGGNTIKQHRKRHFNYNH